MRWPSIGSIGSNSAKIGTDLGELLTTPGLKQAELETQLGGLIQQQQQNVGRARRRSTCPARCGPPTTTPSRRSSCASPACRGCSTPSWRRRTTTRRTRPPPERSSRTQARRLEASDVVWQVPLPRPRAGDAPGRGPRRRHRARVRLRRERRALHGPLDDGDLAPRSTAPRPAARPSGVHGTGAREGRRPARRHAALDRHRDDDQGLDRSRVRRLRQEHRREPGGRRRGDADDPEGYDPDREEADDRPARHRRDQDGHVQGLPRGAVRREDVRAGERQAGAGEQNTGNNSAEYPVIFSLE